MRVWAVHRFSHAQVGLNIEPRDLSLLVGRIDSSAASADISREDFLHFMTLTEDELDDVCDTLRYMRMGIDFTCKRVCVRFKLAPKLDTSAVTGLKCAK